MSEEEDIIERGSLEIRIGVIGSANCSKSTTIGCLAHNVLDDGRGFARSKILTYQHEQESGRTSSVTKHFITYPNKERFVGLLDLAGHEKYLKTTIYGLSGHYLDYVIIIVDSNHGVLRMTKEHLTIATSMKIPIIVVMSKIDLAPENIYVESLAEIKHCIKKNRTSQRFSHIINNTNDVDYVLERFREKQYVLCPIFSISNKTGEGLDNLKYMLEHINSRFSEIRESVHKTNYRGILDSVQLDGIDENKVPNKIMNRLTQDNGKVIFKIFSVYNVVGLGVVFVGYIREGEVRPGMRLLVGPINGGWMEVIIKSIHNNFRSIVPILSLGESGCILVKFTDGKPKINKRFRSRKGMVLTNNARLVRKFMADVYILSNHSTTIKIGYTPVLNCNNIIQCARVLDIDKEGGVIRGGDKAQLLMEFMYRSEYVETGDLFFFREGRVKGLGRIIAI